MQNRKISAAGSGATENVMQMIFLVIFFNNL